MIVTVQDGGKITLTDKTGLLGIELPSRDQILHYNRVIPAAQAVIQVQLMGFFYLFHVHLYAKSRFPGNGHTAVHDL